MASEVTVISVVLMVKPASPLTDKGSGSEE